MLDAMEEVEKAPQQKYSSGVLIQLIDTSTELVTALPNYFRIPPNSTIVATAFNYIIYKVWGIAMVLSCIMGQLVPPPRYANIPMPPPLLHSPI